MIIAPLPYIVSEQGERTAVVLDWAAYLMLRGTASGDADLLDGLDDAELNGLAEGMLAPAFQARMTELLERNDQGQLTDPETRELDDLLARVDALNTLKARAIYTLQVSEGAR
ncbi:MAG: hypothetical protein IPL60_19045 [Ardenticatenia bacterium]|nr:hypothetical protein [Ardenticatenia bacterium]